jgi:hypothetical protein
MEEIRRMIDQYMWTLEKGGFTLCPTSAAGRMPEDK